MLQRYKAKVADGWYDQLRPRSFRERLDELARALHRLASGQSLQQPAIDDLERQRAFGGISADEERREHERNLDSLDASGDRGDAQLSGISILMFEQSLKSNHA